MKRTSKEWQEIFPDIVILDPDGWDRKNFDFSWYQELITEDEYHSRIRRSTLLWKDGGKSIDT